MDPTPAFRARVADAVDRELARPWRGRSPWPRRRGASIPAASRRCEVTTATGMGMSSISYRGRRSPPRMRPSVEITAPSRDTFHRSSSSAGQIARDARQGGLFERTWKAEEQTQMVRHPALPRRLGPDAYRLLGGLQERVAILSRWSTGAHVRQRRRGASGSELRTAVKWSGNEGKSQRCGLVLLLPYALDASNAARSNVRSFRSLR